MDILNAINTRRSVRAYTPEPISAKEIRELLNAAVHAPSAMNRQPWAFVVIQDPGKLQELSEGAKAYHFSQLDPHAHLHGPLHTFHETLANPDYNLFYDAGSLILICATTMGDYAPGDCCLAAENLMLAAHGMGLGTCPIGLALPWLCRADTKQDLGIPDAYLPILPIIVGHPREQPVEPERQPPEVLRWIKRPS